MAYCKSFTACSKLRATAFLAWAALPSWVAPSSTPADAAAAPTSAKMPGSPGCARGTRHGCEAIRQTAGDGCWLQRCRLYFQTRNGYEIMRICHSERSEESKKLIRNSSLATRQHPRFFAALRMTSFFEFTHQTAANNR